MNRTLLFLCAIVLSIGGCVGSPHDSWSFDQNGDPKKLTQEEYIDYCQYVSRAYTHLVNGRQLFVLPVRLAGFNEGKTWTLKELLDDATAESRATRAKLAYFLVDLNSIPGNRRRLDFASHPFDYITGGPFSTGILGDELPSDEAQIIEGIGSPGSPWLRAQWLYGLNNSENSDRLSGLSKRDRGYLHTAIAKMALDRNTIGSLPIIGRPNRISDPGLFGRSVEYPPTVEVTFVNPYKSWADPRPFRGENYHGMSMLSGAEYKLLIEGRERTMRDHAPLLIGDEEPAWGSANDDFRSAGSPIVYDEARCMGYAVVGAQLSPRESANLLSRLVFDGIGGDITKGNTGSLSVEVGSDSRSLSKSIEDWLSAEFQSLVKQLPAPQKARAEGWRITITSDYEDASSRPFYVYPRNASKELVVSESLATCMFLVILSNESELVDLVFNYGFPLKNQKSHRVSDLFIFRNRLVLYDGRHPLTRSGRSRNSPLIRLATAFKDQSRFFLAHELGHIALNTSNEFEADAFALDLLERRGGGYDLGVFRDFLEGSINQNLPGLWGGDVAEIRQRIAVIKERID